jgi:serine/threonine protein kinase
MVKSELYDSKIDIWNIGVLTYELLFGSIPFEIRQVDDINKIVRFARSRWRKRSTFPKKSQSLMRQNYLCWDY